MMAGGGRRSSSFRSRLSVINAIMWVVLLVWVYMLYSLSHPPAAPPFLHLLHNSSATYYDRSPHSESLSFLILGDYGMRSKYQTSIALALPDLARATQAQFLLGTGDNVYSFGVASATDPLFMQVFESVFTGDAEFVSLPWYKALGNHDCRGNAQAQVEYSLLNPRWVLPSKAYHLSKAVPGSPQIEIYVLDTCPLVCGDLNKISLSDFINLPKYKECEVLTYGVEDLLPNQKLEVVERTSAYRNAQLEWLEAELQDTPAGTWKFVVGHHPIYSAATHGDTIPLQEDLLPLLVKHRVHAYFSGHDHTLQHHMHTDPHTGWKLHHFVSGGGGYHTGPHELQTKDKYANWDKLVFGASSMGLMSAQLDATSITITFYDEKLVNLYNTTIARVPDGAGGHR